jgi:hypothetical protein
MSAGFLVAAPATAGAAAPPFAAVAAGIGRPQPSALTVPDARPTTGTRAVDRTRVMNDLGRMALSFVPNVGQTDTRVDFIAHAGGATVFLTPTAAVFAMQKAAVSDQPSGAGLTTSMAGPPDAALPDTRPATRGAAVYMRLVGASPSARPVGQDEQPGKVNYLIGSDPARWHTDVPTFGRVAYRSIYPGVSVAYYGGTNGLEYDFILAPGADSRAIALDFAGASGVELDAQGDLVVHTAVGDLVQHAPVVYQNIGDQRQPVSGRFVLDSGVVRFDVGAYDHSRPLVIDPLVLGYSTYLGGAKGDGGADGIAVDAGGNAYVTGQTSSLKFPTTPGAFDTTFNGAEFDAVVTKLNADGSGLVYSTYLGGGGNENGSAIAVDAAGSAYVTGRPTPSISRPARAPSRVATTAASVTTTTTFTSATTPS